MWFGNQVLARLESFPRINYLRARDSKYRSEKETLLKTLLSVRFTFPFHELRPSTVERSISPVQLYRAFKSPILFHSIVRSVDN